MLTMKGYCEGLGFRMYLGTSAYDGGILSFSPCQKVEGAACVRAQHVSERVCARDLNPKP